MTASEREITTRYEKHTTQTIRSTWRTHMLPMSTDRPLRQRMPTCLQPTIDRNKSRNNEEPHQINDAERTIPIPRIRDPSREARMLTKAMTATERSEFKADVLGKDKQQKKSTNVLSRETSPHTNPTITAASPSRETGLTSSNR